MIINLIRDACGPTATLGVLTVGDVSVHTLERPWITDKFGFPGGEPDQSCVPAGTYQLVMHNTLEHPRTWALSNPDLGIIHEPDTAYPDARYACLIHTGNLVGQSDGCILLGLSRSGITVIDSVAAFKALQAALPWTAGHSIVISEV